MKETKTTTEIVALTIDRPSVAAIITATVTMDQVNGRASIHVGDGMETVEIELRTLPDAEEVLGLFERVVDLMRQHQLKLTR